MTNSWLVSFGDLLTLILCFFITLISLSPLNPHMAGSKDRDKPESYAEVNGASAEKTAAEQSGIPFALNKEKNGAENLKRHYLSVRFDESDFEFDGELLRPAAAEKIKKLVPPEAYRPARLTVESCLQPAAAADTEQALTRSAKTLVVLKRQLIDHMPGLSGVETALRIVKKSCIASSGAEGKQVAAQVVMELEKNG